MKKPKHLKKGTPEAHSNMARVRAHRTIEPTEPDESSSHKVVMFNHQGEPLEETDGE